MPPGRRLSQENVLDFEGWIRMGAADPSAVEVYGALRHNRPLTRQKVLGPSCSPGGAGTYSQGPCLALTRSKAVGTRLFLRKHLRLDRPKPQSSQRDFQFGVTASRQGLMRIAISMVTAKPSEAASRMKPTSRSSWVLNHR